MTLPGGNDTDTADDMMAYLHACKGEPYTVAEWEREVNRLEHALNDARRRLLAAHRTGHCRAARFDHD